MDDGTKKFLQGSAGLFFLALVAGIGWQIFGPTWFKNIKAEVTSQPYARTINVSAEGKITALPDIATINLSVVSQAKTVALVTRDGNEKMTKVIDAVKGLGVDSKDVQSSSYYLSPDYAYPENKAPQITGYRLDQGITVKVRDLAKVDDILDMAVQSGANQVGQLTFDIDDSSQIKKDARTEAFKKAREKAQEMATAAGVRLGRVVTFSEGYEPVVGPMYANYAMDYSRAEGAMAPAPSIEAGSKELVVTVNITYEIE